MDPSACRVIYIDDRFNTERWISREGLSAPTTPQRTTVQANFGELPVDLQANVNAFLTVFNQGEIRLDAQCYLKADVCKQFMSVALGDLFRRNCPKYMSQSKQNVPP